MSILHIVIDDKFIDGMINSFICHEYKNDFVCLYPDNEDFKYIKNSLVKHITLETFYTILEENHYEVLILHSLTALPLNIINQIEKNVKVVWFSWGFDIYSVYPLIPLKNRFWKQTNKYIKNSTKNKSGVYRFIRFIYRFFFRRVSREKNILKNKYDDLLRNAVNRIDYYSGVFPLEYDLLNKLDFFRAQQIYFNYNIGENIFLKNKIDDISINYKANILVGQAAFPQVNHIDIFQLIKKRNLYRSRKIIVPLSYGNGDEKYRNLVKTKGENFFGENFYPLLNFMSIEKYEEILSTCGTAVFGMEQQSGVGNILLCLWQGKKVFLPETSLNYNHFLGLGFIVYSLEKDFTYPNIDTVMSFEDIKYNRELIYKYYSFAAITEKVNQSLEKIKEDINEK